MLACGLARRNRSARSTLHGLKRSSIVRGPLYLLTGTASDVSATAPARYVTLTYQVRRRLRARRMPWLR